MEGEKCVFECVRDKVNCPLIITNPQSRGVT